MGRAAEVATSRSSADLTLHGRYQKVRGAARPHRDAEDVGQPHRDVRRRLSVRDVDVGRRLGVRAIELDPRNEDAARKLRELEPPSE
jgi:hypothetical protein